MSGLTRVLRSSRCERCCERVEIRIRRPRPGRPAARWPARASFGLYNTDEEIDVLVDMLNRIARGAYRGTYEPRMNGAEYVPSAA